MQTLAEVEAWIQRWHRDGLPPLPPVSHLSTDELKQQAQDAYDHQDFQHAKQALIALYERGYERATMAGYLGRIHADCLHPHEAIYWYRTALALGPSRRLDHEHIIYLRDSLPETTEADEQGERRAYFEACGRPVYERRVPVTVDRDPERPLRVGYVSGDWNFHSAAMAFSAVLTQHSPQIVPTIYSTLPAQNYDKSTEEWTRCYRDRFVDVAGLNPSQLAAVIRHDAIDVLVDLSGFTHKSRLATFAARPAPIQIQAWGYVLGTASPAIDYIFADPIVATAALRATGKIVELPSILGYLPKPDLPEPGPLPCLTMPPRFIVPQRVSKINDATCRVWAEILRRVPDASLTFKGPNYISSKRVEIVEQMSDVRHQLVFQDGINHGDHLRQYPHYDLSLDPWPQTGGVSSLEALWMGVPMVTLYGERMISRTTASFLINCGMPEAVAYSEQEYIDQAVALVTTERDRLAGWRATARERLRASPIMTGYVEAVEAAYRHVWRTYCAEAHKEVA